MFGRATITFGIGPHSSLRRLFHLGRLSLPKPYIKPPMRRAFESRRNLYIPLQLEEPMLLKNVFSIIYSLGSAHNSKKLKGA